MKSRSFSEKEVLALSKKAYEHGLTNFEIELDNCALLVIDMQNEFVKPGWLPYRVPEATRQVPKIKKLIGHCRGRNIPVVRI